MANAFTTLLDLIKYVSGTHDWDIEMNRNLDVVDDALNDVQARPKYFSKLVRDPGTSSASPGQATVEDVEVNLNGVPTMLDGGDTSLNQNNEDGPRIDLLTINPASPSVLVATEGTAASFIPPGKEGKLNYKIPYNFEQFFGTHMVDFWGVQTGVPLAMFHNDFDGFDYMVYINDIESTPAGFLFNYKLLRINLNDPEDIVDIVGYNINGDSWELPPGVSFGHIAPPISFVPNSIGTGLSMFCGTALYFAGSYPGFAPLFAEFDAMTGDILNLFASTNIDNQVLMSGFPKLMYQGRNSGNTGRSFVVLNNSPATGGYSSSYMTTACMVHTAEILDTPLSAEFLGGDLGEVIEMPTGFIKSLRMTDQGGGAQIYNMLGYGDSELAVPSSTGGSWSSVADVSDKKLFFGGLDITSYISKLFTTGTSILIRLNNDTQDEIGSLIEFASQARKSLQATDADSIDNPHTLVPSEPISISETDVFIVLRDELVPADYVERSSSPSGNILKIAYDRTIAPMSEDGDTFSLILLYGQLNDETTGDVLYDGAIIVEDCVAYSDGGDTLAVNVDNSNLSSISPTQIDLLQIGGMQNIDLVFGWVRPGNGLEDLRVLKVDDHGDDFDGALMYWHVDNGSGEWHGFGRYVDRWQTVSNDYGHYNKTGGLGADSVLIPPGSIVVGAASCIKAEVPTIPGPTDIAWDTLPPIAPIDASELKVGECFGKSDFSTDGIIYDDGNPVNNREWRMSGVNYNRLLGPIVPMVLNNGTTLVLGPSVPDYRYLDPTKFYYRMDTAYPNYQGVAFTSGQVEIAPFQYLPIREMCDVAFNSMVSVPLTMMVKNKQPFFAGLGLGTLYEGGDVAQIDVWDRPEQPDVPGPSHIAVGEAVVPPNSGSPVEGHVVRTEPDYGHEFISRPTQSVFMKEGHDARGDMKSLAKLLPIIIPYWLDLNS